MKEAFSSKALREDFQKNLLLVAQSCFFYGLMDQASFVRSLLEVTRMGVFYPQAFVSARDCSDEQKKKCGAYFSLDFFRLVRRLGE